MARKLKHSKIKNTSILFELLTRQITADVLEGKSTKSVKIVKKYINLIMKDYGNNICLSGGFFQNSVANYEFLKMNSNIFVVQVCHDGGTSIGLAHHLDYIINKNKPIKYTNLYQGPIYNNKSKLLHSNILSEEKIKIILHCSIRFKNGTYKNLMNTVKVEILGTIVKNNVTDVSETSSTTSAHIS